MLEDESIQDHHLNILDIANSFESLGEKISDEKLVRQILRSLPKRFDMKVTAIEEAQDISSLKVDELIGSLQNFEITVNNKTDKKGKGIAFTSSMDSEETQGNHEDDEDMFESLALIGRQFRKIFKQFDRRFRPNGQNTRPNIDYQPNKEKMARSDEKNYQYKGAQCLECEGYGHIRTECATFIKKQKKSLAVLWSDGDDSDDEVKTESANHVSALIGRIMSDTESCEEDMTYDELVISYYDLITKNTELTQKVEEHVIKIAQPQDERFDNLAHISELNDELSKLNSQLELMKEHVGMMTADSMFKHSKEHQTKKKPNSWVCDHCKGKGHIRPYCFKLHDESKQFEQKPYKKRWTPRSINTGLIAHTSLRASSKED